MKSTFGFKWIWRERTAGGECLPPRPRRPLPRQCSLRDPRRVRDNAKQKSNSLRRKTRASFLAQAVTKSTHGFNDVPRFSKLLAKTANMRIDRAGIDHAFVTPDFIEQTILLLHAAAALHQCSQKFELQAGQIDALTIYSDFMARWIDGDWSGRKSIVSFFGITSAQDRFDAQNNFARAEWFRHVIVGAEFQTDDAVDLLRSRGQHQDWNVTRSWIALQNFANLESGHFRQHQIENDEVRTFRARFGQTGGAIAGS